MKELSWLPDILQFTVTKLPRFTVIVVLSLVVVKTLGCRKCNSRDTIHAILLICIGVYHPDWVRIAKGICSGLREVRIQIPTAVKKGDSAILNCWYDTEGDPLYTVKWYKGGREFYRYAPNEIPIFKTFPIGNLTVKKSESNATQVALTNLELDAAGVYSCEVSADAPSFQTACVQDTMNIVAEENLTDERTGAACKKNPLKPHVRTYSPLDTNESEWQISQIGLQFLVTHEHFAGGKLKIRCSASIYDIYWQSTEVSFEEDRAPPKVIQYQPAATIVGIDYLQPPPNFQTGQKKPDGHVGVKAALQRHAQTARSRKHNDAGSNSSSSSISSSNSNSNNNNGGQSADHQQ
ncbi:hypothetical protein APICC_08800 [Apis cerana cerana]|uniref:Ig-like domain-containing protein n=1 Tax=Apis cerana cerana TaxID=94128 RepID=A0A2A3EPL6_APICC|nr:hypothetical protein APICC_08800 [Apis cerana cerana]